MVYHLYRPYRSTRFLEATLCPCNNANNIIHERILHIYRSCIHFSIGTDGQHLLPIENWLTIGTDRTDGQGFGGLPYALAIMLTSSFTKGFCTFTDRVFISSSVPTDNFDLPMHNWFTIGTDHTDGQGFWGLPHALAIMLTTSFTKGFCTFTDRVFISPSVPTDNFDLPMDNWFTIGTDRTHGQGFWGLPHALAIMLTISFTKGFCTFTDRVFISPSVPTDNFDLPMDNWFTICTDRTHGQGFWGATLCPCNNANYLIHERIFHICRPCIHFSIRTDGQLRFTDGQLVYYLYRPYPWTRFLGATLCPCNNANYLIHERILHIYRSCIHFFIRTDGQLRFTDGQLVYHRYRPYRWTRFLGATLCPCNNANYLIHERILLHLPIVYSFLHRQRRTTSIYRWTIGLPSVPTVPMDKVFGRLPYALPIMLTSSFTKGLCTFTDRVFISPSVPTDNFDLPMDNWFTICTDRTHGQGFWGATLCPCNNANYLIHERIFHICRPCIHFSIRTDGQLRFTDGQLVYYLYRPRGEMLGLRVCKSIANPVTNSKFATICHICTRANS